jgi:two-component sensor histidine kinase
MWENCKNWWNEQYTKFFPNTPKTAKERIDWANDVYKKAILKNDSLLLAEAYYLFGKYEYGINKNYLNAKLWFLKSLWIQEEKGPSYELTRLHYSLGHNELLNKNYYQALVNFQKAKKVAETSENEKAKVAVYTRLAAFYSEGHDIYISSENKGVNPYLNRDSALVYLQLAETSANKLGDPGVLTTAKLIRQNISENPTPSEVLEKDVEAIRPKEAKSTLKVATILKLAESYIQEAQWEKAQFQLTQAEKAHKEISYNPNLQRAIDIVYIHYFEKTNQWEKAFELLRKVKNEDQKLLVQQRNGAVSDLKKTFESEQKEIVLENQKKELELYAENIQLQNKFLWVSVFLIAVSLITAGLFFLLSRKNRQISKQNALLVQEQNHRFNNNLQTISSLLTLKSNELNTADAKTVFSESKLLIQAIASLQRKLYSSDKLVSVDLHHLIPEVVSEVLAAFNMSKVKTIFEIPPIEVYADDALNLNLIFTELTINACKHAFNTSSDPLLKISMNGSDEQIGFCFRDNGSEKVNYTTQSFGMFLIKQLVKQMQGNHTFYYDNGTVCEVKCKVKILA